MAVTSDRRRANGPPKVFVRQLAVRIDAEMSKRMEDYRFDQRFHSEVDAVRSLIEIGLDAFEASKRKEG